MCGIFTAVYRELHSASSGTLKSLLDCHTAMASACSSHLPFCQVIAGRGAPEVSHASTTDMPSITVLSRGPLVILGAMPVKGDSRTY